MLGALGTVDDVARLDAAVLVLVGEFDGRTESLDALPGHAGGVVGELLQTPAGDTPATEAVVGAPLEDAR